LRREHKVGVEVKQVLHVFGLLWEGGRLGWHSARAGERQVRADE
jgi:hypothetical protein